MKYGCCPNATERVDDDEDEDVEENKKINSVVGL